MEELEQEEIEFELFFVFKDLSIMFYISLEI